MSSSRSVACATAPSTDQAYGACPCSVSHGEKWSLETARSKPTSSARTAQRTRSLGPLCSVIRVYPKFVTPKTYPFLGNCLYRVCPQLWTGLWIVALPSGRAVLPEEGADGFARPVTQLGAVRESGDVVVELAEQVRGLLGHAEVGAEGLDRPAQAHDVEDRVARDERARLLVEQRDVSGGVARCVHDP